MAESKMAAFRAFKCTCVNAGRPWVRTLLSALTQEAVVRLYFTQRLAFTT